MKTKFFISNFLIFTLLSCNNTENRETQSQKIEMPSIGGNRDENGCLTAAGQTWSKLKNDCIQVFSEGIRLNPVNVDSSKAIISAFVLPNTDSSAYELFLADKEETFILNKTTEHIFSNGAYAFDKKRGNLVINDTIMYTIEK